MKALVLAGGTGTRLRPFSYSVPKQLIPIAGRPVLAHVLDNIRALGVEQAAVIVGGGAEQIEEEIGDGSRFGLAVTYLQQERPLGLAHCVLLARPFLGDDDFVMYLGDNLLPEGVGALAAGFAAVRPAAHVVVRKVADPRAFGVAEFRPDGSLERVVEKPDRPRSDLALIGVYFFTAAIHRAVAAIEPSARGELEITDAIQWLVERGEQVTAAEYTGFWRDVGRVEDVLACNRRLLADLPAGVEGQLGDGVRISGPVVVEAGARLERSSVEGPALIGAGTVVEDSEIGPGTSIGRDCLLRRAQVRDSVVMDGVSLTAPLELRDSLIGRGAVIGMPPGDGPYRLMVGDATRIEAAT